MKTAQGGRRVAFLGATRGMGRALARQMAERGDLLFLLGRDADELERSAADLRARSRVAPAFVRPCAPLAALPEPHNSDAMAGTCRLASGAQGRPRCDGVTRSRAHSVRGQGTKVGQAHCDLEDPESFAPALDAAVDALGGLDVVVVTAGIFATQQALEDDPELLARLLRVDFTHSVLFCEEARRRLLAHSGGTLCVFSSVAGERGRKPVVLYGASKAGLSRYLEGLDHRYRAEGLRVLTVKPGFVRTGMTAGLKEPPFAGDPEDVARSVLKAMDRGQAVVYAPAPWRAVMAVIRHLPRAVMRRVEF